MSMMCRPKWPFLHMYGSHDMRHVDFRGLTGSQRTPRVWGVIAWYQSVAIQYLGLDGKRVRSCIHFALMNGVNSMLIVMNCVGCMLSE